MEATAKEIGDSVAGRRGVPFLGTIGGVIMKVFSAWYIDVFVDALLRVVELVCLLM